MTTIPNTTITYVTGSPTLQAGTDNTISYPVTYTLTDNSTVQVDVPIFVTVGMTEDDITTALNNRGISEQAKVDNAKAAAALLATLGG